MSEDDLSYRRLFELFYLELHEIARRTFDGQPCGHTLQPTALLHEVYEKLAKNSRPNYKSSSHFIACARRIMRQILIDHSRRRDTVKRGNHFKRVELHDDVAFESEDAMLLFDALAKLGNRDRRQRQIVILVYCGYSLPEIAKYFGVSLRTVKQEWEMARAWLHKELSDSDCP